LKKDAPLRKLCEREKNAAAIECYPDSPKDVAHLIESEAAAAKLAISPDAKALLVSLLGQDRLATRAELAKLMLYAHGAGEIGLEHVEAIVSDASSLILDDAVNGAFDGDLAALESGARRALTQATDVNQLLGAAMRHALSLRRARLDAEGGGGAAGQGEARGGFSRARVFDSHMRAWTGAKLARAVEILAEATLKARLEPKLAEAIALRALWSIALAARARSAGR
jgi:DNA polymerase-3 subunit delta